MAIFSVPFPTQIYEYRNLELTHQSNKNITLQKLKTVFMKIRVDLTQKENVYLASKNYQTIIKKLHTF